MIEAYVLIQTKIGKLESVASEASRIGRVATAAVVAGPYDVIVRVSAEDLDSLGRQVVSEIQVIDGVTRTLTCPILHLGMGDHNTGVAGHRHHPRRLTPPAKQEPAHFTERHPTEQGGDDGETGDQGVRWHLAGNPKAALPTRRLSPITTSSGPYPMG